MKKYKLIIFDIDGTLFNTAEGIVSSVKYALDKNHLILPKGFNYSFFIGPAIQDSIHKLFPFLTNDIIKKVSLDFRDHYKDVDLFKAYPYDGLYEVLEYVKDKGIHIAVGTYKRQDYAYSICDHFGITKYTNNIHGQDFAGKMKKADILEECLAEANICPNDALMVGDTSSDGEAAKKNNIDFVEVDYGFGFTKDNGFLPRVGRLSNIVELKKYLR